MSRRVVVAVDSGAWSVRTAAWLRHLLAGTPARIWFVRVQSGGVLGIASRPEVAVRPSAGVRVATSDLAPLAASLREMGLEVEPGLRMGASPPAIAALAEEVGADLVVLAVHDAELSRVWIRRVLEDMARAVAVPVLVVPDDRRRVG